MSPTCLRWLSLSALLSLSCTEQSFSSGDDASPHELAVATFSLEPNCERGQDLKPANGIDDCDEDADSDGISNRNDVDDSDPKRCWDEDKDGCDDCSRGVDGSGPLADNVPSNDGVDTDFDGKCDLGDPDDDNDGVCDTDQATPGVCRAGPDSHPLDKTRCLDSDADLCDDCSSGKFDVRRDGPDGNADGRCDLSDDFDGDGVIDTTDLDADNDGIPDALENVKGIDPDGDADNDGVPNQWDSDNRGDGFANACNDRNGDGRCDSTGLFFDVDNDDIPNHLDLDADGDGIPDVVEAGFAAYDTDSDGRVDGPVGANGLLDALETTVDSGTLKVRPIDTDGDGAIDALDTDSDGDGVLDSVEGLGDGDGDGIPDAYDPVTAVGSDSDGDGFTDAQECPTGRPCADTDGDGVPNYATADEDGDGVASKDDLDDDNDGILDSVEGEGDPDGDGIPSRLDLDSDGDGILDVDEARTTQLDTQNGRILGAVGVNGIPDIVESAIDSGNVAAPVDTDGDGRPDYLDDDSDADTVKDAAERGTGDKPQDSDGDKVPDYRDNDDDADGIATKREVEAEALKGATPDNDGVPAYLDADSDGDGRSDADEGDVDRDGNQVPDFVDAPVRGPDSDNDGYLDEMECPATPCRDLDSDGRVDMLDADDDGDGIASAIERARPGSGDTDGDGKVDAYDDDDDGDGVPTAEEEAGDSDGDGVPDILDNDDDGDGVPTLEELDFDSDGDGTPDRLSDDDDGDGVPTRDERAALKVADLDGDGLPQHRDADDDGDGLSTRAERPNDRDVDTDGDGAPNHYDADDDGDGVDTADERDDDANLDTDGDGIADHLDADDDGDGIATRDELGDADGNGVPDYLEEPGAGGTFGGAALCATSTAPGASFAALWALALLSLAFVTRRRGGRLWALLALAWLGTAQASAQVAVEQFRPALLREDGFGLSRPVSLDRGRLSLALMLDYAREPLVYERPDSTLKRELPVIEDHLVAHAGVSVGLGARFTFTGSVPVHLVMRGEDPGPITPGADGAGLGDVALQLRTVIAEQRHLAFGAELTARVPTAEIANGDQTYSGDKFGSYEPALMLEARAGRFDARARVGARFRAPVELRNFELGQELVFGAGARLRLVDALYAHLETNGSTAFSHFANDAYSPLEALLGLKYQGERVYAGAGAGPGLLSGYGSPSLRAVATLGYALGEKERAPPPAVERDSDADGVLDSADRCPSEAEDRDGFEDDDGCPDGDNDRDGVADGQDKCPNETEDRDGFEDEDGCPDTDNDGDGIPDAQDKCPSEAEDRDGFEDEGGCPDLDRDGDGIPDAEDACPDEVGVLEHRGCAPKAMVEAASGQIRITEHIEFESGSDALLESSSSVLTAIADTLAAHPEIKRLRVEGHADDRARDALNMRLSKKRAASVMRWLSEHGVAAGRLEAYGCGENRPLDPAQTEEARRKNRRVELHIVKPNERQNLKGCERATPKSESSDSKTQP